MTYEDTHAPSPAPSELFGYEIFGVIGHGAGSTIYAASHPQTRQICALKHVVVKTEKDTRFVDQLKAEYEVGRQIHHPALRQCIEYKAKTTWTGKTTEAALIMELFEGAPLDEECPADLVSAIDCFVQVAQGMAAMHHHGFVHCDLKPANVLVAPSGEVKVIDLGQACPVGTKKPRIQGTPDYIAPEQVKCLPVTPRTDVFNFGATLYFCLTRRKLPTLFTAGQGENSFLVDAQIPSPHDVNPAIPENLSNLVMECVRTRAEKRPGDMGELIRRLETIRFALERRGARAAV